MQLKPYLRCGTEKREFEDYVQRFNMIAILMYVFGLTKSQNFTPSKYCVPLTLTNSIWYADYEIIRNISTGQSRILKLAG
jgi:hypothetical protein